jgi:ATP-dependent Clp protease ATP-binding subunit ClpC
VLDVHPAAMARIVEQGYHPELGARALKRSVERQLTAPIAARLAALPPDAPTVITIYPSADGLAPQVQPLVYARRIAAPPRACAPRDVDAALDRVEDFMNEVEEQAARADPGASRVSAAALSPEHFRYFAVREQIQRIDRLIRQVDQAAGAPAPSIHLRRRTPRVKTPRRVCRIDEAVTDYSSLSGDGDVHARLATLMADATPPGEEPADRLAELLQECALLAAMTADEGGDRLLISFRASGGDAGRTVANELRAAYANVFSKQNGFVATPLEIAEGECAWMLVEMPGARAILAGEMGTHVVYGPQGVTPVQITATSLDADADPLVVAQNRIASRERWHARVAAGEDDPNPEPLGTVVRITDPAVATLDLRTGLICPNRALGEDLRRFILAALPVPPKLAMSP